MCHCFRVCVLREGILFAALLMTRESQSVCRICYTSVISLSCASNICHGDGGGDVDGDDVPMNVARRAASASRVSGLVDAQGGGMSFSPSSSSRAGCSREPTPAGVCHTRCRLLLAQTLARTAEGCILPRLGSCLSQPDEELAYGWSSATKSVLHNISAVAAVVADGLRWTKKRPLSRSLRSAAAAFARQRGASMLAAQTRAARTFFHLERMASRFAERGPS